MRLREFWAVWLSLYMWDTVNMQTQKVSKIPPFDGTNMVEYSTFLQEIDIINGVRRHSWNELISGKKLYNCHGLRLTWNLWDKSRQQLSQHSYQMWIREECGRLWSGMWNLCFLFSLASTFCANKKCYVNNYGEFQMDTRIKSSVNYMSTSMLPVVSINLLHKHAISNTLFHIISSISVIRKIINWSKLSTLLRPRPIYIPGELSQYHSC